MIATRVSVTEAHIANGKPCKGAECPIALALLDALAAQGVKVATVQVDDTSVEVEQDDAAGYRKFRADLNAHAASFVEAFDDDEGSDDRDEIVAPFELWLTWREVIV